MNKTEKIKSLRGEIHERERSYPYEAAKSRAAGVRLMKQLDALRRRLDKLEGR